MNILAAVVLIVVAGVLVWKAIPSRVVSNAHLEVGVENAGPRKWLSLLMIVSGFFCLTAALLLLAEP